LVDSNSHSQGTRGWLHCHNTRVGCASSCENTISTRLHCYCWWLLVITRGSAIAVRLLVPLFWIYY